MTNPVVENLGVIDQPHLHMVEFDDQTVLEAAGNATENTQTAIRVGALTVFRSVFDTTFAALEGVTQEEIEAFAEEKAFPTFRQISRLKPEVIEERIEQLRLILQADGKEVTGEGAGTRTERQQQTRRIQFTTRLKQHPDAGVARMRAAFEERTGKTIDWTRADDTDAARKLHARGQDDKPASQQAARNEQDLLDEERENSRKIGKFNDEAMPSGDGVRLYLNEAGQAPLLNKADEIELSKRMDAGLLAAKILAGEVVLSDSFRIDQPTHEELSRVVNDGHGAKDRLLRSNVRLVISLAKKYGDPGVPFLDIVQEGNIGLVRAAEKFDYTKGFKFSTYATWWIRQAMSRGIPELNRVIRLPVHRAAEVDNLVRLKKDLESQHEREITVAELAGELDISEKRVKELLENSKNIASLDQKIDPNSDASLGDFIPDSTSASVEKIEELRNRNRDLQSALNSLTPREQEVVRLRHGLDDGQPRLLRDIAEFLGVSYQAVNQVEQRAMKKLRNPSRADTLRDYLDD